MLAVTTLKDLLDGVRIHLSAHPVKTALTNPLTAVITDKAVTLSDADAFEFIGSRALLEIGNEVMLATSINGAVATVLRSFEDTPLEAHAAAAVVKIHPTWGWTDRILTYQHIPDAIRWLKPHAWITAVSESFAWSQGDYDVQIPASAFISGPQGNYIINVERRLSSGAFIPFYGWQLMGQSLRFSKKAAQDYTLHVIFAHFQRPLNGLAEVLDNDDFKEAIETYAASLALNALKTNRVRFSDYAASLNDRASTPDELIRLAFDLKNQAIVSRDNHARQMPAGFLSTYRDPS